MKFSLSGLFALGLAGCLPVYNGPIPGDFATSDFAGTGDPTGDPGTAMNADLAGSVKIDAFTSSGTASITPASPSATLRLNETQTVSLSIAGNGQTGTAMLALAKAPDGVTATFNPASVTLGATPVTATMTLTAASDMDTANATSVATSIQLTSGAGTSSTTFGLTVTKELLVTIASGVATTNDPTAFGAMSIPVKMSSLGAGGTNLVFVNKDGIEHRIHADGTGGLNHEPNNMAAGNGEYDAALNATAGTTIKFYCHIHPGMTGQIVVK